MLASLQIMFAQWNPTLSPSPSPNSSPIPVSTELTNPTAWNSIFQTIGFSGGLVVLFVVVGLVVLIGVGVVTYRATKWVLGPDGWGKQIAEQWMVRFDLFLTKQEVRGDKLVTTLDAHLNNCNRFHEPGGPCHVVDLREAGHSAAEALRKIGRNETCDNEVEMIHKALRSGASVTPESIAATIGT